MKVKKMVKYILIVSIGLLTLSIVFNNKQLESQVFGTIKYRDVEMKLGNIAQEESSIGVTTDQGLQRFCGLQLELLTL